MKCDESNTIVVLDECHDILAPIYYGFVKMNLLGNNIPRIGLSATIDKKTEYGEGDDVYTKLDLLNSFCPIVYRYTLSEGIKSGTNRHLRVFVIKNNLDTDKNIKVETKTMNFMTSEQGSYEYYHKAFNQAIFMKPGPTKDFAIRMNAAKRAKILYTLPSKIRICEDLLRMLKGRTIIFGNDVDSLLKITPNCVTSRNSFAENQTIMKDFNEGRINTIASFKILEQGINLKNLQNIILHSYYGKTKSAIQRLGRLRADGTIGNVFIIVTTPTQELKWFNAMMADLNVEIIWCDSPIEAIKKSI
jgi:superfamily II DNA or RNA helicase